MKKYVSCILFILFNYISATNAATFSSEIKTIIAQDDTIDGDFWVGSEAIEVNGTIEGDLVAAARDIKITGLISQDIFAAGQTVNIDGTVKGDITGIFSELSIHEHAGAVRMLGNVLFIEGEISKDVFALATKVIIAEDAKINGSLYVKANSVWINGHIAGKVRADVFDMTIAGIIDQSANIKVINNFTLENSAEIKGTLVYESNKEFDLSEYKGLQGGVEHKKIQSRSWFSSLRLFLFIWSLIAALIVGYVMAKIWPYQFIDTVNILIHSPGRSAIYGFIVFILTPLIAIVSMLLVVTIPASLILLGIYFIALYLAKIYTGGVIGHLFYRSIGNQDASIVNKMIVGILILYIFLNLPVVGDLVLIGSMILGLGGAFQILIYGIHLRSKIAKSV